MNYQLAFYLYESDQILKENVLSLFLSELDFDRARVFVVRVCGMRCVGTYLPISS